MGKKMTPEEKAARAERRAARSDRTLQNKANEIASRELANRIQHDVTPPEQNGRHDRTTPTG